MKQRMSRKTLEIISIILVVILLIFGGFKLFQWIRWGLQDAYKTEARIVKFTWERRIILEWYDKETCYHYVTDSEGNTTRKSYDCSEWRVRDIYTASGESKELHWPKAPEPGYRERLKQTELYTITGLSDDQYSSFNIPLEQWKTLKKNDRFQIVYNNFGHVARLEFEHANSN